MGLDFLRNNSAHRMRDDVMRPLLLDNDFPQNEGLEQDEEQKIELSYEVPAEQWYPIDMSCTDVPPEWDFRPTRFIDGKDLGRTVAWLQTEEGFPISVRLSEIGAIVIHHDAGYLQREWYIMERVVSMIVDPFPWDEIESFAAALQEEGFRLLQCQEPRGRLTYDFQEMRKATQNRSMDEMMRLEKQALLQSGDTPILVDGRLESRTGGFDELHTPVVGMIKGHQRNYLHPQGWRTYYDLRLGQRTPTFLLKQRNIDVVSWYLRLDGTSNDLPNWGIVRLEIPASFFNQTLGREWSYINRLSRLICQYRCRDKSYQRVYVNWLLLHKARQEMEAHPSADETLQIVPIILNVKGFDLFHIDRRSNRYRPEAHLADWQAIGIDDPQPFQHVTFYAPQMPGGEIAVSTGRTGPVQAYSWSLRDVIEQNLFSYLFAEVDANDANFGALVLDIENWLTYVKTETDGTITRLLRSTEGMPQTFRELLVWAHTQGETDTRWSNHHPSTRKKFYRRLLKLVYECHGVLRIDDQRGKPLAVTRTQTSDPQVIDLFTLAGKPEIQRFVVATVLRQLVEARTGTNAIRGLVYLVTLDELNRFAPRGASDSITRLIETVAAEMRSQGIILLGAQQQASKVSEKVIENAALRVLGRTGTLELDAPVWRFLSASAKNKATVLPPEEKLIIQDNFREPMHVRIPFPAWAMNPHEAVLPRGDYARPGSADEEILTY